MIIIVANFQIYDMNLLNRPCIEKVQHSDPKVNVDERWSSLEKELIYVGKKTIVYSQTFIHMYCHFNTIQNCLDR